MLGDDVKARGRWQEERKTVWGRERRDGWGCSRLSVTQQHKMEGNRRERGGFSDLCVINAASECCCGLFLVPSRISTACVACLVPVDDPHWSAEQFGAC